MSIAITRQDINFLKANVNNPNAIKSYLDSRGLSDKHFSPNYVNQAKQTVPEVIRDYAVGYESARKLYFSTLNSVKNANNGKIPLTYKPLLKKYLNYWKSAGQHIWILFLIDNLSSVKIFNNDGSVNLLAFRDIPSDNNLSGIGVVLGALAIVGGLVAITIISVQAIKMIQQQAAGNRPYKTLMQLTDMYASGKIQKEQYDTAVASMAKYIQQDRNKSLFTNILWYSGGILLTFASGYVIYQVMIKKKSIKEVGSDIVGKLTHKGLKNKAVSSLLANSASTVTQSVLKNIPLTGSSLNE